MLLLLSAAHGFMVTAGPRSSASMSTRRSFVVAASDIDKCCAGPPCPAPGSAPTHFAHAPRLASAGLSRESTHTHLTRTTSSATSRRRACTAVHMQQRAMHTVVPRDARPQRLGTPRVAAARQQDRVVARTQDAQLCMPTHKSVAPRHSPSGPWCRAEKAV